MTSSENKVINVLISEGMILRLELKAGPEEKVVCENGTSETASVSAVDPGHLGRDGEWW